MSLRRYRFWSWAFALCVIASLAACSSSQQEDEWAGEDSFFGEEDMAIVEGGEGEDFGELSDFSDFEDFEDFGDFEGEEFAFDDSDMDFSDFDDFDDSQDLAQDFGGEEDFFFDDMEGGGEVAAAGDPLADDAFGSEDWGDDPFADEVAGNEFPAAPLASVDDFLEPAPDNLVPLEEPYQDPFEESVALSDDFSDPNAQLGLVPVKKIDEMPRHRGGSLLNAVYIGRPGDSVESVSQKIYGQDRSSEIVSHNPWLSDGIKVGEKLYYNSPNRPSDNTAVLTYYEDVGTVAQSYVSGSHDNIRSVSTDLLGFDGAWKEVWATNLHVASKDILPAGTELRYWTGATPAPTLAQTAPAAPINDVLGLGNLQAPEEFGGPSDGLLPPPPEVAGSSSGSFDAFPELAPPDDFSDPIAAQAPAPMPVEELNLPPPPPAPSAQASQSSTSGDSDLLSMIAIAAVGVGLLFLIVSLAKKRRPVSMEYTQV